MNGPPSSPSESFERLTNVNTHPRPRRSAKTPLPSSSTVPTRLSRYSSKVVPGGHCSSRITCWRYLARRASIGSPVLIARRPTRSPDISRCAATSTRRRSARATTYSRIGRRSAGPSLLRAATRPAMIDAISMSGGCSSAPLPGTSTDQPREARRAQSASSEIAAIMPRCESSQTISGVTCCSHALESTRAEGAPYARERLPPVVNNSGTSVSRRGPGPCPRCARRRTRPVARSSAARR